MRITIKDNFPDVKRYIDVIGKQARYAAAVALTRTAHDVRNELRNEMGRIFDRPTPYTLRSLYLSPARRDKLEAVVWVKDDRAGSGTPATKYLLPQIEGGSRSLKRFEYSLQTTGSMPKGWFAVPAQFARLDAFGNVSRGQIIQILSQLKSQITAGFDRNISTDPKRRARARKKAGGQFVAFPKGRGRLVPGIYLMVDEGGRRVPKPVFIYVRSVKYKRLFRFEEVATRTALARFPRHFETELRNALRSAK